VGQTDITELGRCNQGAGNSISHKLLTRIPKRPHTGRRAIHALSFLYLRRLNCIAVALPLLACGLRPTVGHSQQAANALFQSQPNTWTDQIRDTTCKIVYLGIVGGTETPNNSHSGVVQIRDILQGPTFPGVCAKSFSPYVWRSGFHWVLTHFPSHPGQLTGDELEQAPKVILVGHSLGGWAVLSVARNLSRKGISVDLCVQIDSVGITDHTVPRNVKAAAIFHASDAMFLLTTKSIKLEDPIQTKLVADILIRNAGHWSVTRDPRIKGLVLCTVEALSSAPGQMSTCPFQSELERAAPVTERPPTMQ
jgi:hypothetical protein